jgi:hypothetical protein
MNGDPADANEARNEMRNKTQDKARERAAGTECL